MLLRGRKTGYPGGSKRATNHLVEQGRWGIVLS